MYSLALYLLDTDNPFGKRRSKPGKEDGKNNQDKAHELCNRRTASCRAERAADTLSALTSRHLEAVDDRVAE